MIRKTVFLLAVLTAAASATPNPSASYCIDMGYNYVIDHTPDGDIGICQFPDGSYAEAWPFLRGESRSDMSYCKINGLEQEIANDSRCPGYYTGSCVICALADGSGVEASALATQNPRVPFTEDSGDEGNGAALPDGNETVPEIPQKSYGYILIPGIIFILLIALTVLILKKAGTKNV